MTVPARPSVHPIEPRPLESRPIKTRRIRFRIPSGSLDHLYVKGPNGEGDLVMSHAVAMLSAVFPEGEDFFVRAVRNNADAVTDPVLAEQVKGFVGQEVTHGREHRELNDRLQEMGYPTHSVDAYAKRALARIERVAPRLYPLAVTAALEHYTATFAETLLTDPRARELLGESDVRSVLLWHALEESEHKSVAFDVYRAAGGTERMRKVAMLITTCTFLGSTAFHTARSLHRDRDSFTLPMLVKSLWALRRSPFLTKEVRRTVRGYLKSGFHPSDHDNGALLEEWTATLFGDRGLLTDRIV